jgi:hypothetical protein
MPKRIAIYGDASISRDVGKFFGRYGDFSRKEDNRAFVDLMCQMRHPVTGSINETDWAAISQILFGEVVGD